MADRRAGPAPPPPVVSEEEAEKALHFLRETCEQVGRARGVMIEAEHMLKVVRSQEVLFSEEKSADRREAEALASANYRRALDRYRDAVIDWETMVAKRKAAEMWLEAWRTSSATLRAARI